MQIGNSVDRYLGEAGLPSLGVVVDAPVLAIVLLRARQVVADHPVDSVSQLLYRTARRLCLFRFISVVPPSTVGRVFPQLCRLFTGPPPFKQSAQTQTHQYLMHFDLANGKICLTKTDCAGVIWTLDNPCTSNQGKWTDQSFLIVRCTFWHERVTSKVYMRTQIAVTFTNWVALNLLFDGLCL